MEAHPHLRCRLRDLRDHRGSRRSSSLEAPIKCASPASTRRSPTPSSTFTCLLRRASGDRRPGDRLRNSDHLPEEGLPIMAGRNSSCRTSARASHEGEIVRWIVKEGDALKQDQPVVEVMTDKATVEIPSPSAGVVSKHNFAEGAVAKVGDVIFVIEQSGAAPKSAPAAKAPRRCRPPRRRQDSAAAGSGAGAEQRFTAFDRGQGRSGRRHGRVSSCRTSAKASTKARSCAGSRRPATRSRWTSPSSK
jgi:biotin carboxyl carrier protein